MNSGTTIQAPRCGLMSRVVLVSMLAGLAGPAQAEDSLAPDMDARYRSSLKEALAEYDANHFEEARILFRRAHEINPNARTLRSIGMASFELRDYVAAVRALSASLLDPRKPLSADQRAHVQGLLEKSRMYVDTYTLKISPADARVLINGRAPDTEPDGTVLLGFGSHNLEASKPGYVVRTLPLNVRGGERKEFAMTLEKKLTAAVQPGLPGTAGALGTPSPQKAGLSAQEGGRSSAVWFIAAGVAALAAGGTGALWLIENNELNKCHNPPGDLPCNNESAILGRRNLAAGATLATGAAALTMAVIGLLSHDSSSAEPFAQSAISCAISPSGLLCTKPF